MLSNTNFPDVAPCNYAARGTHIFLCGKELRDVVSLRQGGIQLRLDHKLESRSGC